MALLNLPLDLLVINVLLTLACVLIVYTCLCRIVHSKVNRWRVSAMQLMCLCFTCWAAHVFFVLMRGVVFEPHDVAAAMGILLHLHLTRRMAERAARGRHPRGSEPC
jgi:hypothetical protein